MEPGKSVIGIHVPSRSDDVNGLLQDARSDGFDYVSTILPHSSSSCQRLDATAVESKWWSTSVIGNVSSPPTYNCSTEKVDESAEDRTMEMETDQGFKDQGQALIKALNGSGKLSTSAEKHLSFMLEWAAHMNIPAVILPAIIEESRISYGRFLATHCLKASANQVQLWMRVPFTEEGLQSFQSLHKMIDGPSNVGAMICFDQTTNTISPDSIGKDLALLHKFCGSNLRAVCFNTKYFLTNKKGYPTLSKASQFLFIELLKRLGRTIRLLVEGDILHHVDSDLPQITGQSGYLSYVQYLRHLREKEEVTNVLDTDESRMEFDYLDHLQSPLQPCFDNLEFSTYEVFERDPVKYVRYREAIEKALIDRIDMNVVRVQSNNGQKIVVSPLIMVVGAGRGPLVKASLTAVANINNSSKQTEQKSLIVVNPQIIAVEKNSSAVIFLNSLKHSSNDWNVVEVVECDMRRAAEHETLSPIISGPEINKADIVVSELLGSFGDNELSPECLLPVQRSGLMKEDCINIPQSYTSFLAPASSMRLHAEVQAQAYQPSNPLEGPAGKPSGTLAAMETPYVVRSHAAAQTHKELACWTFEHYGSQQKLSSNKTSSDTEIYERHSELLFNDDVASSSGLKCGYGNQDVKIANVVSTIGENNDTIRGNYTLHGFLGTFHCVLYKSMQKGEVIISIAPHSFSTGMYSWFPLFFPLREPLIVPRDSLLKCNIWRKTDSNSVWYEWYAEIVDHKSSKIISSSNLHNPKGRSYKILL